MKSGVLDSSVFFWPPVPKAEMPGVLAASSLCLSVFLPIAEMSNNSANKFFDALAAGRPIGINYGGWQADILERSGAGLVLPPEDQQAAANQLVSFLENEGRVRCAGEAARELARREFDRDLLAKRFEKVLVDVVNRKAKKGRP